MELVVDYGDAQALANTTRRQIDDVLRQLKAAGITTVAITEDTLGTLNANGVVTYKRDGDETLLTFAPGFPGQRARVRGDAGAQSAGPDGDAGRDKRAADRLALAAVQHHSRSDWTAMR